MTKAKFPLKEVDIMALAQELASGLEKNGGVFPAPPVEAADLKARIVAAQARINDVVAVEAQRRSAVKLKNAELDALADEMRQCFDYAEFVTRGNDAELKLIGWSGRAAPKRRAAPAQPLALEIIGQGAGWVKLAWKESKDGSAAMMFKILRRIMKDGGDMREAGSSIVSDITLVDQPRGIELEFAVIAVNKAGNSDPSNSISIVL